MSLKLKWPLRAIIHVSIIIGLPVLAFAFLLISSIKQANETAQQISDDLGRAGYRVLEVDALEYRAIILNDGREMDVLIREDGAGFAPYLDCPVLPDGRVSSKQCAALPIP